MRRLSGIELTGDEEIFLAHIDDLSRMSEKNYSPEYTAFLDERRQMLAETALRCAGAEYFRFFGGYENAVRRVLCIYPEYNAPEDGDFPVKAIKFTFRRQDAVTHSQLLGTVMSLGIKRELTGDMICGSGCAYALLAPAAAALAGGISKIGRVGVKTSYAELSEIVRSESYESKKLSVSSLRLDCIISAAAGISRGKAAELIRSEGVDVNYIKIFSPDHSMSEGDVFSARGKGKYIFESIDGSSRSGRTFISVKKYS